MNTKISRYLFLSLLKTFVICSVLTLVGYQIINAKYNYTLEQKQGNFIEAIAGVFWTLVLTLSTITVYLNLIKPIRRTPILCFLSFFLLPLLITIFFWYLGDHNGEWLSFYVNTFLFFCTLAFFYIKFNFSDKNVEPDPSR